MGGLGRNALVALLVQRFDDAAIGVGASLHHGLSVPDAYPRTSPFGAATPRPTVDVDHDDPDHRWLPNPAMPAIDGGSERQLPEGSGGANGTDRACRHLRPWSEQVLALVRLDLVPEEDDDHRELERGEEPEALLRGGRVRAGLKDGVCAAERLGRRPDCELAEVTKGLEDRAAPGTVADQRLDPVEGDPPLGGIERGRGERRIHRGVERMEGLGEAVDAVGRGGLELGRHAPIITPRRR